MGSVFYYIKRLVRKDYRENIVIKTRSPTKTLISAEVLVNNFEKLNDNFLTFKIENLNKYFDDIAWKKVVNLHRSKSVHSLCSICKTLCLEECVCCSDCKYWYHFKCVQITAYYKYNEKASWPCKKNKTVTLKCNL